MRRKSFRIILVILGFISLIIGIVGAFVPVLPTFPFLMITLYSFLYGSERLKKWFINTKLFQIKLEPIFLCRAMTRSEKIQLVISLTVIFSITFIFVPNIYIRIIIGVVWVMHLLIVGFHVKTVDKEELAKMIEEAKKQRTDIYND